MSMKIIVQLLFDCQKEDCIVVMKESLHMNDLLSPRAKQFHAVVEMICMVLRIFLS